MHAHKKKSCCQSLLFELKTQELKSEKTKTIRKKIKIQAKYSKKKKILKPKCALKEDKNKTFFRPSIIYYKFHPKFIGNVIKMY